MVFKVNVLLSGPRPHAMKRAEAPQHRYEVSRRGTLTASKWSYALLPSELPVRSSA